MAERGSGVHWITDRIIDDAARIEQEKHGKALTPDEARTLKVNDFLRKIAPYAYEPTEKP